MDPPVVRGWFCSYDDQHRPGSTPPGILPHRRASPRLLTASAATPMTSPALRCRLTARATRGRGDAGDAAGARGGRHRGRRRLRGPGPRRARWSSSATRLPGERVRARVTAARPLLPAGRRGRDRLSPSPDRVEPPCPHAGPGRCGGCDFQHVALGAQRRLKAFRVEEQLARAGRPGAGGRGGAGRRGRRRPRLAQPGAGGGGRPAGPVGFRRHRSHQLEHVDDCPVASPAVAATGALDGRRGRARPSSRWSTGHGGGGRGGGRRSRRTRRASPRLPRHRHRPGASGGKVRRAPGAVHAAVRGRTLPGVARGLLAGPRRRRRGAARRGPRPSPATLSRGRRWSTSTPAPGCSRSLWRDAVGPTGRSWPSSGTGAPARTPGTTARPSPASASCRRP